MSAFICSDKQFIETINGYLTHCKSNPVYTKLVEWANILKRENVRSVNHRYNERTKFEPVMFEPSKSNV